MANVSVYNIEGNEVGTLELNDSVFGVEVNEHLVHLAVVAQLANKRQGTQKAKTRSEVSGGGRKPWRQKGTGHARQGSTRSPQWKGGGVVLALSLIHISAEEFRRWPPFIRLRNLTWLTFTREAEFRPY